MAMLTVLALLESIVETQAPIAVVSMLFLTCGTQPVKVDILTNGLTWLTEIHINLLSLSLLWVVTKEHILDICGCQVV